jgi:hypothetical protein
MYVYTKKKKPKKHVLQTLGKPGVASRRLLIAHEFYSPTLSQSGEENF